MFAWERGGGGQWDHCDVRRGHVTEINWGDNEGVRGKSFVSFSSSHTHGDKAERDPDTPPVCTAYLPACLLSLRYPDSFPIHTSAETKRGRRELRGSPPFLSAFTSQWGLLQLGPDGGRGGNLSSK